MPTSLRPSRRTRRSFSGEGAPRISSELLSRAQCLTVSQVEQLRGRSEHLWRELRCALRGCCRAKLRSAVRLGRWGCILNGEILHVL